MIDTRPSRTPLKRQEARRRVAERNGVAYRTREEIALYRKNRAPQKKYRYLCKSNGFQAWNYWLKIKAPDWWIEQYYKAMGKPWLNCRLTNTQQRRVKYQNDIEYQTKERLRRQINKKFKKDGIADLMRVAINKGSESNQVERTLGYSIAELIKHLEKQFNKGMSWEAFRKGKIHIDHIVPQKEFNLTNKNEWKDCWSLSNLQPLWAKDNWSKSSKAVHLL